jgi:ribonuclease HI
MRERVLYRSSSALYLRPDVLNAAIVQWPESWKANGWKRVDGQPVANQAIIRYILSMMEVRRLNGQTINIQHVMAHSTSEGNNAADQLAKNGRKLKPISERDWAWLTHEQEQIADAVTGINIDVSSLD